MNEEKEQKPTKHKLRIEFVYQKKRRFLNKMKYLIQNKPFKFGLRIKNIDDKDSPRGKIKNLSLKSGEGGSIVHDRDEEFAIPELNPGQEVILWWPDTLTTIIKGETWIDCRVEPEDRQKTKFITYQYDSNCKKEFKFQIPNAWGDGLLIRGELEQQQAMTNFLIFILTTLIFLDGVWGLDKIFKGIFSWIGWLFSQIGLLLTSLG